MIAKNIKAQAFAGVVNYVIKKDSELLKAEGVMAMSAKDMTTSFELQSSVRPEIKSPVGHIPISFAEGDKERMTNQFMTQLAEEYMQEMGITDTQYIIVRHHDGSNEHFHIVYNRIDNSGKLITDKNDYKRNIATCKRLKDRHNLTYGKDKFKVKREKLRGSERVKHDIYHIIREEIVRSRNILELQKHLKYRGVEINIKFKRGTTEPQGVSFIKDNYTFKGSQIDRNFSLRNLLAMLKVVDNEYKKIEEQEKSAPRPAPRPAPQPAPQPAPHQEPQQQQNSLLISGSLVLLDLPTDSGDDPEETQFRNRMQWQQRRKRGRRM